MKVERWKKETSSKCVPDSQISLSGLMNVLPRSSLKTQIPYVLASFDIVMFFLLGTEHENKTLKSKKNQKKKTLLFRFC